MNKAMARPNEKLLESSTSTILPIEIGGREVTLEARAYQQGEDQASQALVLIHGKTEATPLVRIQSGCVTGEVFHSLRCDCYEQLWTSLEHLVAADYGILIYLPYHEGRGIGLINKIRAYAAQDQGMDTVDANLSLGAPVDARDYGIAAAILADLGHSAVRLLTNNPDKVAALEANGITVAERLPLVIDANPHNANYLRVKKERLDHLL